MVAFEVTINGQRRYIAGHLEAKMLNVMFSGAADIGATRISVGVHGFVAVPGGPNGQLTTLSYPSDWPSTAWIRAVR